MRLIDIDAVFDVPVLIYGDDELSRLRAIVRRLETAPTIDPESLRPKWISVEDRLPKAGAGKVLVVKNYRGKRYVDIGEIIEGEAYCYSDEYAIHPREHKLTHWMPLPELPTKTEEVSG